MEHAQHGLPDSKDEIDVVSTPDDVEVAKLHEQQEVFQKTEGGVDFRTVSWPRAAIIFLKVLFATGVLSIPSAMYALGAVPGALIILGWGALNCYVGIIQGDFRNNHPHCHSVADMAGVLGGAVVKELVGALFLVAWVLCSGAGLLGVSVALNALSDHAICTVYFSLVATVLIALTASVRTFQNLSWLTWVGFVSIYVAVFIIVVGVSESSQFICHRGTVPLCLKIRVDHCLQPPAIDRPLHPQPAPLSWDTMPSHRQLPSPLA